MANFTLLVFLALRNTPLALLSGRSYEKLRPLHKTAGYTCIATSLIHAIVYLNAWAQIDHLHEMRETENLAGAIAGLAMVIIGLSTISWVMRRYYECTCPRRKSAETDFPLLLNLELMFSFCFTSVLRHPSYHVLTDYHPRRYASTELCQIHSHHRHFHSMHLGCRPSPSTGQTVLEFPW